MSHVLKRPRRSRALETKTGRFSIGGDFLLIYQVEANAINFVRTGTHAELFGS